MNETFTHVYMKTDAVIALAGGRAALADLLGVSVQATYAWGDEIPQVREWQIRAIRPEWFQAATGQKNQAARLDRIVKLADELTKEARQWRAACHAQDGRQRRARA